MKNTIAFRCLFITRRMTIFFLVEALSLMRSARAHKALRTAAQTCSPSARGAQSPTPGRILSSCRCHANSAQVKLKPIFLVYPTILHKSPTTPQMAATHITSKPGPSYFDSLQSSLALHDLKPQNLSVRAESATGREWGILRKPSCALVMDAGLCAPPVLGEQAQTCEPSTAALRMSESAPATIQSTRRLHAYSASPPPTDSNKHNIQSAQKKRKKSPTECSAQFVHTGYPHFLSTCQQPILQGFWGFTLTYPHYPQDNIRIRGISYVCQGKTCVL